MNIRNPVIYRLWYEINKQEYSYIGYSSDLDNETSFDDFASQLNNYKKYFDNIVSQGSKQAKNNLENVFNDYEFPEKQRFTLKVVLLSFKYDFDWLNFEFEELETKSFKTQGEWTKSAKRTYYIEKYNSELQGFNGLSAGQGYQEIPGYDEKIKRYQDLINQNESKALPWVHYKLTEETPKKDNKVWRAFIDEIRPMYQQKTSN